VHTPFWEAPHTDPPPPPPLTHTHTKNFEVRRASMHGCATMGVCCSEARVCAAQPDLPSTFVRKRIVRELEAIQKKLAGQRPCLFRRAGSSAGRSCVAGTLAALAEWTAQSQPNGRVAR
jgi:hypothetical protein